MEAVLGSKKKGRKQQQQPWGKKEVRGGGGGVLILGGVLVAAAVGAGTAFMTARRAQGRRSSATAGPANDAGNEEKRVEDSSVEGHDDASLPPCKELMGNQQGESPINRTVNNIQGNNGCNDVELPTGIKLDMICPIEQIISEKLDFDLHKEIEEKEIRATESQIGVAQHQTEQTLEEPEFVLVNGIKEQKEVLSIESGMDMTQRQSEERSEFVLVTAIIEGRDLLNEEKEAKDASSIESEHGMDHHQTEQKFEESELVNYNVEKEDEASLEEAQLSMTELAEVRSDYIKEIEIDDGIPTNSQFGIKEYRRDRVGDEREFAPAEETGKEEEEVSPTEITEYKSEPVTNEYAFSVMKQTDEQEEEEASKVQFQEEVKSELDISQQETEHVSDEVSPACNKEIEIGEGIPSTNSQISMKECQSDCGRDEREFVPVEDEEVSPTEMTKYKPEQISDESALCAIKETGEQEKDEASKVGFQEEAKSQLDMSQQQTEQVLDEMTSVYIKDLEIDEGTPSTNSQLSMKEFQTDHAEELEKEEVSPTEMTEYKSETTSKEPVFSAMKEIDEQEEDKALKVEKSKTQLDTSQQQTEQVLDESKFALVHGEKEQNKEALSTESEYCMKHHQTELSFEKSELTHENDENEDTRTQSGTIESQLSIEECPSDHVRNNSQEEEASSTMKKIDEMEEDEEASSAECQKVMESSTEEEEEEEAEREERSDSTSTRFSSTELRAEAIWPAEVIEQEKILRAVEKDTCDQFESSGEIEEVIHATGAEEHNKETILGKEATTDNMIATKLITNRERPLKMDNFVIDNSNRLFLLFLVVALILGVICSMNSDSLNHFTKLSYQLYQMLFPTNENRQEV